MEHESWRSSGFRFLKRSNLYLKNFLECHLKLELNNIKTSNIIFCGIMSKIFIFLFLY